MSDISCMDIPGSLFLAYFFDLASSSSSLLSQMQNCWNLSSSMRPEISRGVNSVFHLSCSACARRCLL